ncbi:phosphopantetheine--protein transferase-like protein [Chitinophaga skermanii]|uniref:Phosphopantetheine--protein transferase-like protein n=1 Tax=Chitinophaga skermanii TaxID=331697 RepID=A0A327R2T6_9BACT|nr:4'-phosphopantetheinyl transferase superfamily protein [Chitinophaga skermanii]RAJ11149.1 phosphopantetheine--protein transferase-like protein [Chitinophaga skermanii]
MGTHLSYKSIHREVVSLAKTSTVLTLYFTVLPAFTNETWEESWQQLDLPAEWKYHLQFPKHIPTAAASLAGKAMLKKYCYMHSKQLRKDKYGRPYLLNSPIDFNISHAGDLVVLLVSDRKIGVDVEKISPIALDDFEQVFTQQEWQIIGKDLNLFYRYWTIKEAVMKADGRGMHIPLQSIHILPKLTQAFTDRAEWQLIPVQIVHGYACTIACLPGTNDQISIIQTPVF